MALAAEGRCCLLPSESENGSRQSLLICRSKQLSLLGSVAMCLLCLWELVCAHLCVASMAAIPLRWQRSRLGAVGALTCSVGWRRPCPSGPKGSSSSPRGPLSHSWLAKPARLLGVCRFPVLKAALPSVCPSDGSCWFAHSGFKFTIMLRIV